MTREELKEHCKKQVESCEKWAIARGEEPNGKVYEEHKLILELLEQTKWIPVSERLPEVQKNGDKDFSDWVQVTIDISRNGDSDVYVCEAYYCFSENKWYTKRFVIGVVTAWMPLPEPYVPDINVENKAESEGEE